MAHRGDHHGLDQSHAPERGASAGATASCARSGREFLLAIYGALRTVKMYPPDNPVVQKTMQEVVRLSNELLRNEREVELRVSGEFIFINATRLRLDLENYASFNRIITRLQGCGRRPLPHARWRRPCATGSCS